MDSTNTMKKEIQEWIIYAKNDLDTAQYLFDGKKYKEAALFCQQAVEKILKMMSLNQGQRLRKIHDLVLLAKDVELPSQFLNDLKVLTGAYIYSRYPGVPVDEDIEELAKKFLHTAKEVIKWSEENL